MPMLVDGIVILSLNPISLFLSLSSLYTSFWIQTDS